MYGLVLDGYQCGNLKNTKVSYNNENRIVKCKGYVYLLDSEKTQVASRKFNSIKMRREIIEFWKRTYRLEEKSYYIIISPTS